MPNKATSTFWEKAPFVKGVFDALELDKHLHIEMLEGGLFHGDLQLGKYSVLVCEISPNHVRHSIAVQLINRMQCLVREIELEK